MTETFLSLLATAAAVSWTPGPNNALLAASGARFGFRRTLPHVLGIALGLVVMIVLAGTVLSGLFHLLPWLGPVLRWCGAGLLLWLAWLIATGGGSGGASRLRPFTLLEAAAFQWINPKAWLLALAITGQSADPDRPLAGLAVVLAAFLAASLSSASAWALMGERMGRLLGAGPGLRLFNGAMAGLLVLGVVLMLAG